MSRFVRYSMLIMLAVSLAFSAACRGDKKTKVAAEERREGRDRELLGEGLREMQNGKYIRARLLFSTLVNTYGDSSLLPVTKLAIADCFYREGSFSAMNQSEIEYRDWLQFFPKHELADDVMMKIAEVHMRQVQAPDRDTTHARLAERQLLKLLQEYPSSDLRPRAEAQLWEVREILGMHELKVARFYFKVRESYKASASRTREIIEKYPEFSRTDEALFLLGVSMFEQEDTEEAITHFTRLCRYYPDSAYYEDAVGYLKRLDAPVPDAAAETDRPKRRETPGIFERTIEAISHPRLENIDKDGVLFRREEPVESCLERALKFSVTSGGGVGATASSN